MKSNSGMWRRVTRWGLAVSLLAGLCGAVVLLPVFRFPDPGGKYEIGTMSFHWVDESRPEMFTTDHDDHRELMVQVWYPATSTPSTERARYLPEAANTTAALERVFGLPKLSLRALGAVRTHSIPDAPPADTGRFPVLLFLEGLGGFRQMNTFQIEHLVSRGYVVVALDQPYAAASVVFPDGRVVEMTALEQVRPLVRQSYLPSVDVPTLHGRALPYGVVPYLAEDIAFVLDELESRDQSATLGVLSGRLDLHRVGAVGSSLGGIVISEAARSDSRLDALLLLDAPVTTRTVAAGLDQPTMWITRPPDAMREERRRFGGWSEAEIAAHHQSMRATFNGLRAPGWLLQVPGTSHLDFTDVPLSWLARRGQFARGRASGRSHDGVGARTTGHHSRRRARPR